MATFDKGMFTTEEVYSDLDSAAFEALPESAPHRNVDYAIIEADKEGYVKTYIVLPSTIYGLAIGPLVTAGLQNPHSIQAPLLVKSAVARGQGGMIGEGLAKWPNVHIDDRTCFHTPYL